MVAGIVGGLAFFASRAVVTSLFFGGLADWKAFTPPGEHITILMPCNPVAKSIPVPGQQPSQSYSVDSRDASFRITIAHLTDADIMAAPWQNRFRMGQQGALKNIPGSKLTSEKPVQVDDNPGVESVIAVPGKGTFVMRILGVRDGPRYCYVVLAVGGSNYRADSPDVRKFLDSLHVPQEPITDLIGRLATANPGQKVAILQDLRKRGPAAGEAVPALTTLVKNPADYSACIEAAELLGDLGPASESAVPALTETLRGQHPRKNGPDNGNIRLRVAGALTQIEPKNDFALEVLKDCVSDRNPPVRIWANYYLARLNPDTFAANRDALIREFLAHGNDHFTATDAMVKLGPLGQSAVPDLIKALSKQDSSMKMEVIRVLEAIGPPAREALPALRAIDVPGQPEFRQTAEKACAKIEKADG